MVILKVITESGEKSIRKARLCWLLQDDAIKISSDIKHRFITQKSIQIKQNQIDQAIWRDEEVARGDYIILL